MYLTVDVLLANDGVNTMQYRESMEYKRLQVRIIIDPCHLI